MGTDVPSWNEFLGVKANADDFAKVALAVGGVAVLTDLLLKLKGDGTPTPTPNPTVDKFGAKMIYPTKGNTYYVNMAAKTYTEFLDGGRVTRLPNTVELFKKADGTIDYIRVPATETPRWVITGGWRNVEVTWETRWISGGQYLQVYSNGEQHSTDRNLAWRGSANKTRMRNDGAFGFIKELYHESGNSGYSSAQGYTPSGVNPINNWVRWKHINYNVTGGRKFEAWVEKTYGQNDWVKVREYTDTGSWSASTGFTAWMTSQRSQFPTAVPKNRDTGAEMKINEIITWAGDYVSFRSDNSEYDFRNVSVREI